MNAPKYRFWIKKDVKIPDSKDGVYLKLMSIVSGEKRNEGLAVGYLDDFIEEHKSNFPAHLRIFFDKKLYRKYQQELGRDARISKGTFRKIFNRKGKESGAGYFLEYLDVICMCIAKDTKANFFETFSIRVIKDLAPYCTAETLKEISALDNFQEIYTYHRELDETWEKRLNAIQNNSNTEVSSILSNTVDQKTTDTFHESAGEARKSQEGLDETRDESDKTEDQYDLAEKSKRTGTSIENKWRFCLLDKKKNPYSQKVWSGLKEGLDLESNDVKLHAYTIWSALEQYILECREDETILNNAALQDYVDNKAIFLTPESIVQLFNRGQLVTAKTPEYRGCDLRTLDVLTSFISALKGEKVQTFIAFTGIENVQQLAKLLTPHYKKKKVVFEDAYKTVFENGRVWKKLYWDIDKSEQSVFYKKFKFIILFFLTIVLIGYSIFDFFQTKEDQFVVAIFPAKNTGEGNRDLDFYLESQLKEYKSNNDDCVFKIITKTNNDELKKYEGIGITSEEQASGIARAIKADIIIWSSYTNNTHKDSFTFSLNTFWAGDFDTLASPETQLCFPVVHMKNFNKKRSKSEIFINEPGNGFYLGRQYTKSIENLIQWVYICYMIDKSDYNAAFELIKDKYNEDYACSLIMNLINYDYTIAQKAMVFYREKDINRYLAGKIAKEIHGKYAVLTSFPYFFLNQQLENALLTEAFHFANKGLSRLSKSTISEDGSSRINSEIMTQDFLYYIKATYYAQVRKNYSKSLECIDKGIQLLIEVRNKIKGFYSDTNDLNIRNNSKLAVIHRSIMFYQLKLQLLERKKLFVEAAIVGITAFKDLSIDCEVIFSQIGPNIGSHPYRKEIIRVYNYLFFFSSKLGPLVIGKKLPITVDDDTNNFCFIGSLSSNDKWKLNEAIIPHMIEIYKERHFF